MVESYGPMTKEDFYGRLDPLSRFVRMMVDKSRGDNVMSDSPKLLPPQIPIDSSVSGYQGAKLGSPRQPETIDEILFASQGQNASMMYGDPLDPNAIDGNAYAAIMNRNRGKSVLPASNTTVQAKVPARSGREMEVAEKSSIDDLMGQLSSFRQRDADRDRRMMWLNFASALANSRSPTILGGIAEGAGAIAPTIERQEAANRKSEEEALMDQIKLEQWKRGDARSDKSLALQERQVEAAIARQRALDGSGGRITPAQQLQAAKIILADLDSTDEEKAEAARTVNSIMSAQRGGQIAGASAPKPIVDYTQYKK